MSSFSGLYIGLSALRAHQAMQDIAGHNVANVNTPGYSRQSGSLVTMPPLPGIGNAPGGTGVTIAVVGRAVSSLLNQQIVQENGVLSQWQVLKEGTAEVAKLFHEPGDGGLQGMLDNFWQAWRDLSVDPNSSAARANVLDAGGRVASGLVNAAEGVSDFSIRLSDQFGQNVDRLNALASEMLLINHQVIQAVQQGNTAPDLRDRRDVLLAEMSKLAQIKSAENADGSVDVYLDGHMLVNANNVTLVQVAQTGAGMVQAVWGDTRRSIATGAGSLSALGELHNWAQGNVLGALNQIAAQVVSAVNSRHEAGFDLNGGSGWSFFKGNSAATIALADDMVDHPERVAVAAQANAPADGSIALAIASLAQQDLPALNGSVDEAYSVLVGQVGLMAEKSELMAGRQEELVRFLDGRRQEVSGVSLDDEAVQMMSAQRAFQAAARVITTVDQMLDKLINDTGMVGR